MKNKTKSKTYFKTNAIVTNTIYCYFTKNVSTHIAFNFMAMSLVMYQEIYLSQAQFYTSIIPELKKLKQEDIKFKF